MKTMAQALAERIRYQITAGQKVIEAAGFGSEKDRSDAVLGSAQDVLSVRGNVADVALTNHLWLLDAHGDCALEREYLPMELKEFRSTSVDEALAFLAPRDTYSAAKAAARLRATNEAIVAAVENLTDSDLERPVTVTFYGEKTLRDLLFIIIEHGALHIGQAWGILKGCGYGR